MVKDSYNEPEDMASDNAVEEIKAKLDIVEFLRGYLELKPAGRNFKACCPFHKEKTASLMISPERQMWHCFGCNEGGDVFKFVMKYENLEFYEALKLLAEKANVELKRSSPAEQREFGVLYDINRAAADFFASIMPKVDNAKDYLKGRGIKPETIEKFEIGFAPMSMDDLFLYLIDKGFEMSDIVRSGLAARSERGRCFDRFKGRIMFPLFNSFGKVIGFSGRILPELDNGEVAKYINSPETPIFQKSRLLYGLNFAKEGIRSRGFSLLVEGQMDVIMSHQDGMTNTVGSSGTALTEDQLSVLRRHSSKLVLNFDNDEAGKQAMERSIDLAAAKDLDVLVLDLSKAVSGEASGLKDPADLVRYFPGELEKAVQKAVPAMEYYFSRHDPSVPDLYNKKEAVRALLRKINGLPSAVDRNHWMRELSFRSRMSESDLLSEMKAVVVPTPLKRPLSEAKPLVSEKNKRSRKELMGEQLLLLAFASDKAREILGTVCDYLPSSDKDIYNALVSGSQPENNGISARFADLSLRSGSVADVSDEDLLREASSLALNLEIESLSERISALEFLIKNSRSPEETERVMAEFSEAVNKKQELEKKK